MDYNFATLDRHSVLANTSTTSNKGFLDENVCISKERKAILSDLRHTRLQKAVFLKSAKIT